MSATPSTELIFISDLHLAAGYLPKTAKFDSKEEFFADTQFAHCLNYLEEWTLQEKHSLRLVFLGDVFDFLRVPSHLLGGVTQVETPLLVAALDKLNQIAAGHPLFFQALAKFVRQGFLVDIIPGNHDIELMFPTVQQHLRTLIANAGQQSITKLAINFHPWIYYAPGLVYAEHGQQYHDINAFATLIQPYMADAATLDLVLGSHFERYLLDLITAMAPTADHVMPALPFVLRTLRANPAFFLTTWRHHLKFGAILFQMLRKQVSREAKNRRTDYQYTSLALYAQQLGIEHELLVALDQLSPATFANLFGRICRQLLAYAQGKPVTQPYMLQAAHSIHGLLQKRGCAVPFYLFGHTHQPMQRALTSTAEFPMYLNCGTWTSPPPTPTAPPASDKRFTYIHIRRDPALTAPSARLFRWCEIKGQPEQLWPV